MQFGCHQLSLQQQQQQQSLSPKFLGWLLILNKLVRVGHMYSKSNNSNCSRIWKKKWKNLIFTHNKKKKKKKFTRAQTKKPKKHGHYKILSVSNTNMPGTLVSLLFWEKIFIRIYFKKFLWFLDMFSKL